MGASASARPGSEEGCALLRFAGGARFCYLSASGTPAVGRFDNSSRNPLYCFLYLQKSWKDVFELQTPKFQTLSTRHRRSILPLRGRLVVSATLPSGNRISLWLRRAFFAQKNANNTTTKKTLPNNLLL